MAATHSSIPTDSAELLKQVLGHDSTATFESDPRFTSNADTDTSIPASSENLSAADLDEDLDEEDEDDELDDLDEDEEEEDEEDEDDADEDDADEDVDDDEEDFEDDDEDVADEAAA